MTISKRERVKPVPYFGGEQDGDCGKWEVECWPSTTKMTQLCSRILVRNLCGIWEALIFVVLSSIVPQSQVRFVYYNELCRNMHFTRANCFYLLSWMYAHGIMTQPRSTTHTRAIASRRLHTPNASIHMPNNVFQSTYGKSLPSVWT